jgi:hypothetical protein
MLKGLESKGFQMEQTYIWQKQEADLHRIEKATGPRLLEECRYFKPGVGFQCKVRDVGLYSYVECLEIDSRTCPFSLFYAYTNYCSCRARVLIAKALEK